MMQRYTLPHFFLHLPSLLSASPESRSSRPRSHLTIMISAFTAFITGSSTSSRSADLVNNAIEREVRASASSSDRTLHVVHRTAWEDHAVSAAMVVALTAGTYYVSRLLMKHMSSSTTSTATAAQASRSNLKRLSVARTAQLLSRIGAERLDDVTDVRTWLALRYGSLPSMSSHEQTLLGHVILPGAITASFDGACRNRVIVCSGQNVLFDCFCALTLCLSMIDCRRHWWSRPRKRGDF